MDNMVTTIPWSDLPDELLEKIRKHLDTSTKIYVSRFRAVCRSWRSSIPPCNKKNLLFPIRLRINPSTDRYDSSSLTLTQSVIYHLEPPPPAIANVSSTSNSNNSRSCLIKVKQGESGKTQSLHPLSPFRLQHPPNSFPKVLNLLDFRVFELAKALHLISNRDGSVYTYKVAMSSNSGFPAILYVSYGKLYHHEFGVVAKNCTKIHDTISQGSYQDVIFYKGKLYAVAHDGRAVVVDSSLKVTEIASRVDGGYNRMKYFAESLGELLLVDRYYYVYKSTRQSRRRFKVYKLNAVEKKWVEMKSVGDRILFVGEDCCFSASAQDFPGSQGNCIYFSYSKHDTKEEYLSRIGVFGLDDGTSLPLEIYPDCANIFEPGHPKHGLARPHSCEAGC